MKAKLHQLPESEKGASRKSVLLLLAVLVLAKAAFVLCVMAYSGIGLGPDEAQYWTWSQQLAFGYYSKPPAIAWQIWAGTKLFGNTELGVRFASLLLGSALPFVIYGFGRAAQLSRKSSFWAAMVFAWSPLGMMAAFLAITDTGMVLCWAVASLLVARHLGREEKPGYYLLGLVVACGALFKWVMLEFWIAPLAVAFFLPKWRSWSALGGFCISLLGFLPSVIWSAGHEWATFRHVGSTIWSTDAIEVGTTPLVKGNFFDFLGAQAALFSPVLFVLFLIAVWALWRGRQFAPQPIIFCGWSSAGLIAAYLFVAAFKKMQGNWVDFAYPAAAVLVGWRAWDSSVRLRPWLLGGLALSLAMCAFAFMVPMLQSESLAPIPYKLSPFKHNVGWKELGLELAGAGYDPDKHFLVADKYQTTSVLSFYGAKQKRAYFLNLQGIRKNQFSYWPSLAEEQKGKTGYFVVVENYPLSDPKWARLESEYKAKLMPYFKDVRFLGVRPLFYANGQPVKGAMLFKAVGYTGLEPGDAHLY